MAQSEGVSALVNALAAAMGAVGYIQMTGENKEHGYKYASDEDLLGPVQAAFAKYALVLVPIGVKYQVEQETYKGEAGKWRRFEGVFTFRLYHESGEWLDVATAGAGRDTTDKAQYKAATGAYKYALRQLLAIPTGEDAEKDAEADGAASKATGNGNEPAAPQNVGKKLIENIPIPPAAWAAAGLDRRGARGKMRKLGDCDMDTLTAFAKVQATTQPGQAFADAARDLYEEALVAVASAEQTSG